MRIKTCAKHVLGGDIIGVLACPDCIEVPDGTKADHVSADPSPWLTDLFIKADEQKTALAAAKDDVLRAAKEEALIHECAEREHITRGRQRCPCALCAAVDRWQKLEGT